MGEATEEPDALLSLPRGLAWAAQLGQCSRPGEDVRRQQEPGQPDPPDLKRPQEVRLCVGVGGGYPARAALETCLGKRLFLFAPLEAS